MSKEIYVYGKRPTKDTFKKTHTKEEKKETYTRGKETYAQGKETY